MGSIRQLANDARGASEVQQVVCLGSSAGGLEALGALLRSLPADLPFCYLVAQHLSPTRESPLPQLLARNTTLRVQFAEDGMPLAAGVVLVAPPMSDISIDHHAVRVREPGSAPGPSPHFDVLLRSAATSWGPKAIAVVLSGTGKDGAAGVLAVAAAGGVCIAQESDSAGFGGMPDSAVATGAVDLILAPDLIGPALKRLVERSGLESEATRVPSAAARPVGQAISTSTVEREESMEHIAAALLSITGMDFTDYKRATMQRQIKRRMALLQISELQGYRDLVTDSPLEARALTSALLVTVTSFFRDPTAWQTLAEPLRVALNLAGRPGQVRVWVPGCATGQEAYTLGMIVAGLLGHPGDLARRLKIFATDMNEGALQIGRRGLYPEDAASEIPEEFRERWLQPGRLGWEVAPALRDCVVFARHNVALDPPFPKIHAISLRNTLIYFEPHMQERVLKLLHFSLAPGGLLLLGQSERIADANPLFETIDSKERIYRRRSIAAVRPLPTPQPRPTARNRHHDHRPLDPAADHSALRDLLLGHFAPPCLLIDGNDEVIEVVGDVSRWCWVAQGQHSSHVVALVRDELRSAVRSLLLQVRHAITRSAERLITTPTGTVTVQVSRLVDSAEADGGGDQTIIVEFVESMPEPAADPTRTAEPGDLDTSSNSELDRVVAELASTEAALQATIGQLGASNEELQAVNEELQAAAEELQASNEEVQASNEELEATNEELSSLNAELQQQGLDLATANSDLENIQASLTSGLVLVDRELRVIRYTPLAVRLFALIDTDIGRPLTSIPTTILIPDLERRLRAAVHEHQHGLLELPGDRADMMLHVHPYRGGDGAIRGAIVVSTDISELASAHRSAQRTLRDLAAVTDALHEAVWQRSDDGQLLFVNSQVEKLFGLTRQQLLQNPDLLLAAVHPEDREKVALARSAFPVEPYDLEYRIVRQHGQLRWVHESVTAVPGDETGPGYIVSSALDISHRRQIQHQSDVNLASLEAVFNNSVFGVLVLDRDDRILRANGCMARISGYDRSTLTGMPVRLFDLDTPPPGAAVDPRPGTDAAGAQTLGIAHQRLLASNGVPYFVTVETRALDADGEGTRVVIVHDVTRLHEANYELAEQTRFDHQTGLLVRSHFREVLITELARADRAGHGLAVLWIDLDGFKEVNDRYGHQAGDTALREVAARLQQAGRQQDAVGRLGGDEFAMLVTDVDQIDSLEPVTERILALLREPIRLHDSQLYLSGSIGVALAPEDGNDPDILLHSADTAMYSAKNAGRDRRVYFRAEMNRAAEARAGIRHDLAVALRGRQFVMHYQPVIDVATGDVRSAEALVRWVHDGRIVPAGEFMSVAEQTGQLRAIGRIALDLLDDDLRTLHIDLGDHRIDISVNLSPTQLDERDLLDWLSAWEPAGGFQQLIIEVTEAAALARGGRAFETLTLLRRLGARLSIDDFGTGYSNLELLDRLRPTIIKIDRSLLERANRQPRGRAVLHAAIQLAHALDSTVVIEGVQDEMLWQLTRTLDAEQAQGFHLARPMSLSELITWTRDRRRDPNDPDAAPPAT